MEQPNSDVQKIEEEIKKLETEAFEAETQAADYRNAGVKKQLNSNVKRLRDRIAVLKGQLFD